MNMNILIKYMIWIFSDFRNGRSPILVATDVAARGLGKFLIYLHSTFNICDF